MNPIYPYQTRAVRDLAWACFAPPLLHARQLSSDAQQVSGCGLRLTPARERWLQSLDRDPDALLEHLSQQRSHRLGVYFEHLWHFFLARDPAVELLAHNLPVHDRGQTIGEFDCLYFCRERGRHVHLELAVKFFLGYRHDTLDGQTSHWHEWLGPNTRDRLDVKIEHLMQRQIALGNHPLAREQLTELGIEELDREVVIKGYLFESLVDPLPPPPAFNCQCSIGQWLAIDQLAGYLKKLASPGYLILPRQQWLASARAGQPGDTFDRAGLLARLHSHFDPAEQRGNGRPLLVAALDARGSESRRFFVTDSHWPLDARPR